jgi:transcriptional regulator with XRE-family HTH domain
VRIESNLTDEAVLGELGARLERVRLARNLTQVELAGEAGVERKLVLRLEAGESVRVVSLIRVLRALGLLEGADQLVVDPTPGSIDLAKLRGGMRKRASGRRRKRD